MKQNSNASSLVMYKKIFFTWLLPCNSKHLSRTWFGCLQMLKMAVRPHKRYFYQDKSCLEIVHTSNATFHKNLTSFVTSLLLNCRQGKGTGAYRGLKVCRGKAMSFWEKLKHILPMMGIEISLITSIRCGVWSTPSDSKVSIRKLEWKVQPIVSKIKGGILAKFTFNITKLNCKLQMIEHRSNT